MSRIELSAIQTKLKAAIQKHQVRTAAFSATPHWLVRLSIFPGLPLRHCVTLFPRSKKVHLTTPHLILNSTNNPSTFSSLTAVILRDKDGDCPRKATNVDCHGFGLVCSNLPDFIPRLIAVFSHLNLQISTTTRFKSIPTFYFSFSRCW